MVLSRLYYLKLVQTGEYAFITLDYLQTKDAVVSYKTITFDNIVDQIIILVSVYYLA